VSVGGGLEEADEIDEGRGASIGGIAAGDRWVDMVGNECVVTWVRRLGVLAYRSVGDRGKSEKVVDVVRFIQRFRPAAPA
jgi:hypothetical protein